MKQFILNLKYYMIYDILNHKYDFRNHCKKNNKKKYNILYK